MHFLLSPSSLDHLFCSLYGQSFGSRFLGVCCPSLLQLPAFSVRQRKVTAVGTAFPKEEAGTDGTFWKVALSNLAFLDKEQGRAGHSLCPSGPFFFSLGSLLHLDIIQWPSLCSCRQPGLGVTCTS